MTTQSVFSKNVKVHVVEYEVQLFITKSIVLFRLLGYRENLGNEKPCVSHIALEGTCAKRFDYVSVLTYLDVHLSLRSQGRAPYSPQYGAKCLLPSNH